MSDYQTGEKFGVMFIIVIWLFMLVGWVMNLVKLFGMAGQNIDTSFILRILGVILAPIGGVMGWF